jgi:hypothetical protein
MDEYNARPGFGAKRKTEAYYQLVNQTITPLRATKSLSVIADTLNSLGLATPRGMAWSRQRVTTYLRSTPL